MADQFIMATQKLLRGKSNRRNVPQGEFFPIGHTCTLTLRGLRWKNGQFVDGAAITAVLVDSINRPVPGSEAVDLTPNGLQEGSYSARILIPPTLQNHFNYGLVVTAKAGCEIGTWIVRRIARMISA